ncbi:BTB/POZ domain-containing protein KCTD9-like isoform X3 [Amphibalanus amphitrite]|uniref:BTB/POZ domain-containing protein KCTD9-like isoform X3 n=1 Tax=Amphibalanus amphitrite TaxID=1232801 RepID=UPI001C9148C3|nr:BTB/POZ domain-containing protein KCTD9-like isoform X3 [Amphibalanus amphitrite]
MVEWLLSFWSFSAKTEDDESFKGLMDAASCSAGSPVEAPVTENGDLTTIVGAVRDDDCAPAGARSCESALQPGSSDGPRSSRWVTLNVGGRLFTTTVATLTGAEPHSMLARMFSGGTEWLRPSDRDGSGAYLIDRSPTYFEPLLNYLRTRQLVLDQGVNPAGVLEEARYFGIDSLLSRLEAMVAGAPQSPPSADHAPLTRREVVRALLSTPSEASLRFQGVDFTGADLSKLDLRNINFKYACLRDCNLNSCNMTGCCLERADLSGARMDSAQLSCVRMLCANLELTCMRSCNFEDPGGTRANLEGANMKGAILTGSNMSSINLRVATLKNANLQDCDLRLAILAGADLENCNLSGSDLHEANLRGANLTNTAFDLMLTPIHMSQTVR